MRYIVILIIYITVSFGSSDDNLTIHHNYRKALESAKEKNRPLFILFTKDGCRWCDRLKDNLMSVDELKSGLKSQFIVLFLNRDRDSYPKKFKIDAVPTVFMVSPKEEIFTEILGYHSKPRDYTKWFNYVKIEMEE
ncbi:MAG: thioredoxin family protein [Epsilonproteobacteria bacterium]|nr:thioredoxin family protein [Campylobacterota bacterium]